MYQSPMNRIRFGVYASVLAALLLASLPAPALAEQKLGYVNPQRLVNESRLGQAASLDLARFIQERERMARESAAQVTSARKAAESPGLSVQERGTREELFRRKAAQHEALLAENARDIKAEETRLLQYVMRRAEAVLEDIGRKGGYAMIIKDNSVVGYVDKASVDITDRVVRELDAKTK